MQAKLAAGVMKFGRLLQRAGPYVVLEIVLPGGTLFALILYLYRTGQLRGLADAGRMLRGVLRAAGRAFDQLAFALQPLGALPDGPRPRDGLEPIDLLSRRR